MPKTESIPTSKQGGPAAPRTVSDGGAKPPAEPSPKITVRKGDKLRRCTERELAWFAARGWKPDPK